MNISMELFAIGMSLIYIVTHIIVNRKFPNLSQAGQVVIVIVAAAGIHESIGILNEILNVKNADFGILQNHKLIVIIGLMVFLVLAINELIKAFISIKNIPQE